MEPVGSSRAAGRVGCSPDGDPSSYHRLGAIHASHLDIDGLSLSYLGASSFTLGTNSRNGIGAFSIESAAYAVDPRFQGSLLDGEGRRRPGWGLRDRLGSPGSWLLCDGQSSRSG